LPEHWTAPGVHTPVHAPLTHAELVHGAAVPQVPFDWHVCTPLPEHWVAPGVQTPVQEPLTHAWLVHAPAFDQVPVALQV
jgi:hypothetical protein